MASAVPYTGGTSIAPATGSPTPTRNVSTPIGAFGGESAQALQGLGNAASTAGNELFARAAAMQQLDQHAEAQKAIADYTTELAKTYADYSTLEGKAAKEAFPAYQTTINDLRDKYRGTLNSSYAQQSYDGDTRTLMTRTMFSAAKHAGDQFKSYVVGSNLDRASADANYSMQHPEDEGAYQRSLQTNAAAAKTAQVVHGRDDDYGNNTELELNSNLTSKRISGMMVGDPVKAQQMLDDARKTGTLDGGSADKLQVQIDSTKLNKTTVHEAAKLYNDPKNKDATAEDIRKKAEAKAESMFPGDDVFKDRLVQQVETLRARDQTYKRADEFDRNTVLVGAVYGVGNKDGKLPTSVEELSPDAHSAFINANERTQASIMRRLSQNAKGDYAPTPENQANYRYYRGVMSDPTATAEERQKALNMDFSDLHLPAPQAQQLVDMRNKLYKNSLQDNALPHAMSVMGPIINAPELGISKSRNPQDYYRYTGAFGEALTQFADQAKRPANDKEIKEIGTQLLQQTGIHRGFFSDSKTELFREDVPGEFSDKVKKIYSGQGAPEPDEATIQRLYTAEKLKTLSSGFTTLFGKTPNRVP